MKLTGRLKRVEEAAAAGGAAWVRRPGFAHPIAAVHDRVMPFPRALHAASALLLLTLFGQGGCITASFISQAFVQPGPPVVTGVVLADGARAGPGQRLLVRYTVRDPIIRGTSGSSDDSFGWGSYDFAVPLEPDGRPVAPYHYAGAERTAERILGDLRPDQRAAVSRARLRRVSDAEVSDLQKRGRVAEATAPGFQWEFIRLPTAREKSVAVLAFWPRGRPEPPGSRTPAGTVPEGATVLLLPASQRRPPTEAFLSTFAAVAGPWWSIPADVIFSPFFLLKPLKPPAKDPPEIPATGSRMGGTLWAGARGADQTAAPSSRSFCDQCPGERSRHGEH